MVESTHLFSYKRLGNPEEVRDLVQDIFCKALEGDYRMMDFQGFSATVEVDLRKEKLQTIIGKIWEKIPLVDLHIKNISIEEVIKDIY